MAAIGDLVGTEVFAAVEALATVTGLATTADEVVDALPKLVEDCPSELETSTDPFDVGLSAVVVGAVDVLALRNAFASGASGAGASLALVVSDPPEKTSFSAPSIFIPPAFSGFSRTGRPSATTTGTSFPWRPTKAEAPISVTKTAPNPPANITNRLVSGSMPDRTRLCPVP